MASLKLRLWTFVTLFFGALSPSIALASSPRFSEILRTSSPDGKGLEHAQAWTQALYEAQKRVIRTPKAEDAFRLLEGAVADLRFERILNDPLGQELAPDSRLFLLYGQQDEEAYRIDLRAQAPDTIDLKRILSFSQSWAVTRLNDPLPEERRAYSVHGQARLRLGPISYQDALYTLQGLMQGAKALPSATDGVFSELRLGLPKSMALIERYLTIVPRYTEETWEGQSFLKAHIQVHLEEDLLRRDYPAFGSYLHAILERMAPRANLLWRTASGLKLMSLQLDGQERTLQIELATQGNALVPLDPKQHPAFSERFVPAELLSLQSQLIVQAKAKLLGLQFEAPELVHDLSYLKASEPQFKLRLTSAQKPKISGSFAWILPTWAIDPLIPGSMEGYAQTFLVGLMKSRGSDGTYLTLGESRDQHGQLLSAEGGFALIDNDFLMLGLRILQSHLWPKEEVRAEFELLSKRQIIAVNEDMQSYPVSR